MVLKNLDMKFRATDKIAVFISVSLTLKTVSLILDPHSYVSLICIKVS